MSCNNGALDCDNNPYNGCETKLGSANCGKCGQTCQSDQICAKGAACVVVAPTQLGSALPVKVSGTTVGNADLFDLSCGNGNAPDASYAFQAPSAGKYQFDTAGSSFNTVLEIRIGGPSGPNLGCSDDFGGAYSSQVTVTLAQGQNVVVIVDGKNLSQGTYNLNVTKLP
jgi:hypothetical protein